MSARCIRCGGEPLEQSLFCDRCYSAVAAIAVDRTPSPKSPWVERALARRLPAKVIWVK